VGDPDGFADRAQRRALGAAPGEDLDGAVEDLLAALQPLGVRTHGGIVDENFHAEVFLVTVDP
jgi:hypothetical protein